jgi:hypothetical protein
MRIQSMDIQMVHDRQGRADIITFSVDNGATNNFNHVRTALHPVGQPCFHEEVGPLTMRPTEPWHIRLDGELDTMAIPTNNLQDAQGTIPCGNVLGRAGIHQMGMVIGMAGIYLNGRILSYLTHSQEEWKNPGGTALVQPPTTTDSVQTATEREGEEFLATPLPSDCRSDDDASRKLPRLPGSGTDGFTTSDEPGPQWTEGVGMATADTDLHFLTPRSQGEYEHPQ